MAILLISRITKSIINHMKKLIVLSLLLTTSCGSLPGLISTGTSSYETYKTISYAKGTVDIALSVDGKKTIDDRILSKITGYDCKVRRIINEGLESVCKSFVRDE